MLSVNVIYTFENSPQQFFDLNLPKSFIKSEGVFLSYLMAKLTVEEMASLIKISTSIFVAKASDVEMLPMWYQRCSGKFWVDDLERWRWANGIVSDVSKEFVNEFNTVNNL